MTTQNTLYLLISYSIDEIRQKFLRETVSSIKAEIETKHLEPLLEDIIVFDNASPHEETIPLLKNTFKHVYRADKNYGLWSAINWAVNEFGSKYKYVHVMESDLVYYALDLMKSCEDALEMRPDVGCIRCIEFRINEAEKFNKDNQTKDSIRRAWFRHGQGKVLQPITGNVYECSFNPQLVGLLRMSAMKQTFDDIGSHKIFVEPQFYQTYSTNYKLNGIVDGGVHYSVGNVVDGVTPTGSWTFNQRYMETRKSFFHDISEMKVEKL